MDIKLNDIVQGFILKEINEIKDYKSKGYLFEHEKSGAKLLYIENDDTNRVFFTAFKTPPMDDCGTAHILEHSVLCGSKKYRCKDPFNELAKGSLNTYLNALTYSDKTVYPIASTNEKDFSNLMDVYLDAIFNPLIYENREIFMQEGWHYELEDEHSDLTINGVVYNEMKGASSSPESLLMNKISKSLFKTSPYGFESGGDPDFIPELTYEDFLSFHKTYYHPSNAFIYIYGKTDVKNHLQKLNEEYLSKYNRENINSNINEEKDFIKNNLVFDTYSTSSHDETKGYMAYSFVTCKCVDVKQSLGFEILRYILLGTNAAPLKKKLLELGIADDITGWYDNTQFETVFSIVAKKADTSRLDEFKQVVENVFKEVLQKGIDNKLLESSLNAWEFSLKEEDYGYKPKGLYYGIEGMLGWLHGCNPCERMKKITAIKEIREESKNRFFENLIEDYILNNNHNSIVVLNPEKDKSLKTENEYHEKLQSFKNALSKEEIQKIVFETKALKQYQNEEDSKENLDAIPMIEKSDIDEKVNTVEARLIKNNDFDIIYTPLETNDISYFKLMFPLKGIDKDLLFYAGLWIRLLSEINTKKYLYDKIPTEIDLNFGDLLFTTNSYFDTDKNFKAFFEIEGKTLTKNISKNIDLIKEIIFNSDLTDKVNIINKIKKDIISRQRSISSSGHIYSLDRCQSYFSKEKLFMEKLKGIDYYEFLKEALILAETDFENLSLNLKKASEFILNKQGFITALSSEEVFIEDFKQNVESIYEELEDNKKPEETNICPENKKEGIYNESKIVYNSKSDDFTKYGIEFNGKMAVVEKIINLEYLWNKVRVVGGAYGCGCYFKRNGIFALYSYRDPNVAATYEAYENIADFLEMFQADNKQMLKFIIGAISDKDRPVHNSSMANISITRFFSGTTLKSLQKERDELLSTTVDDIHAFAKLFKSMNSTDYICTIGNKTAIEAADKIFEQIKPLDR